MCCNIAVTFQPFSCAGPVRYWVSDVPVFQLLTVDIVCFGLDLDARTYIKMVLFILS